MPDIRLWGGPHNGEVHQRQHLDRVVTMVQCDLHYARHADVTVRRVTDWFGRRYPEAPVSYTKYRRTRERCEGAQVYRYDPEGEP